jgi:predicted alpha/beta hydrolase
MCLGHQDNSALGRRYSGKPQALPGPVALPCDLPPAHAAPAKDPSWAEPMTLLHDDGAVTARPFTLAAEDGYALAATEFSGPRPAAAAALTMIAPAAAVPARYYARFASYLASRGGPVVTFDYRGIGASAPASLRGFPARMRDWCILDVAGAIGWARQAHPQRPLNWLGHSMGGFAPGLAHNNGAIARQLNIATLSGYWRRMRSPERYRVRFLMGSAAPPLVRLLGYFPGVLMGGENMPGPAFLEWARWCMTPEFIFGDPTLGEVRHFATLKAPVRFAQIEDDVWGTPAAVGHMASHFAATSERSIWRVSLAEAKAERIGHLGFFRTTFRASLWPPAAAWLEGGV